MSLETTMTGRSWCGSSGRCGVSTYQSSPRRGRLGVTAHVPFGSSRSEEHTSELQSRQYLVCRLLLEKKKKKNKKKNKNKTKTTEQKDTKHNKKRKRTITQQDQLRRPHKEPTIKPDTANKRNTSQTTI